MKGPPIAAGASSEFNAQNPYPGLAPYGEADAALFFGRARETAELFRLVRRDVATVLFGGSGLGKTSLIHAGLVPLLRRDSYLPVTIRIDFSPGAPDPVAQVKAAIRAAADEAGVEVDPAGADWERATLWELFHRVELWSPFNRLLTPVLVLDQFEELFTIGRDNPHTELLVRELEDLIENQIPPPVEQRLVEEPTGLDFSYERRDFHVIVSLREDFLPLAELLAEDIPSLRRNRMRLGPLTPEQALEAVLLPGARLVEEPVAQEIVRFVADSAEHPFRRVGTPARGTGPEVEPALLSLVCRELNNRRLQEGRERITADLLTASKLGILTDFYLRSLADLPEEVRIFIEEHLLTRSGFRNSIALDDAVETHGISPEHLAALIDRRLLRAEDRLGTRRIELTHDVLTRTIRKSRDLRREREREREQTQRERAELERRQRELEAQHEAQRRRTRRLALIAAGLGVVAAVLLAVTVWAVVASVVAHRSAQQAERQRRSTDDVLNFLLFNIREMLEPIGRLDLLETVAEKVLEHAGSTDGTDESLRNREVAHVILGDVKRAQGDLTGALLSYQAAMEIARRLADAHVVEALWQQDLAVVHQRIGDVQMLQGNITGALESERASEAIARLLVEQDPEDRDRQRELTVNLVKIGDLLGSQGRVAEAVQSYRAALDIMTRLVATDSSVPLWQSDLAGVHERLADAASSEGDFGGALASYQQALAIRRELVTADPGNHPAQNDLARVHRSVGGILQVRGDLEGALASYGTAQTLCERLVELDPSNADWQIGVAAGQAALASSYRMAGDLDEAAAHYLASLSTVERLAAADPTNVVLRSEAAAATAWIGDVRLVQGLPDQALERYRSALAIAGELAAVDPANAQTARLLAFCRQRVGDALVVSGSSQEAVSSYREALEGVRRLRELSPGTALYAIDEVDNLNRLSHALWLAGDRAAARDAWQAAVAGLGRLERAGEATMRRALDGPLGAVTCGALFLKAPDEGAVLGISDAPGRADSAKVAAGVAGFEARRALFEGRAHDAVAGAVRALEADPSQIWINLTLAHGLLLEGSSGRAGELYLSFAPRQITDVLTFREAALADLGELRRAGVPAARLRPAEALLQPRAFR